MKIVIFEELMKGKDVNIRGQIVRVPRKKNNKETNK